MFFTSMSRNSMGVGGLFADASSPPAAGFCGIWERMPDIPDRLFILLGCADWIGYCWSNLPVIVLAAIDLLERTSCALKVTVIKPFSWMNDCEGTVVLPKVAPAWVSVADCFE